MFHLKLKYSCKRPVSSSFRNSNLQKKIHLLTWTPSPHSRWSKVPPNWDWTVFLGPWISRDQVWLSAYPAAHKTWIKIHLLLVDCCLERQLFVKVDVTWHEAELLFHLSNQFEVWGTVERVASHVKELNQLASNVSTCNIQPFETVLHNVAVKHRYAMGNTISTVKQHGCHQALCE